MENNIIEPNLREEVEDCLNIMEQHKLVDSQNNTPKTEKDTLYSSIQNMTDEQLREAVEEKTEVQEGSGANINTDPIFNPTATMIDNFTPDEIMQLYTLSLDARKDSNLNIVPRLPKRIYDVIELQCRAIGVKSVSAIAKYARELVLELGAEIAYDKECQKFQDELQAAIDIPEIVDMFGDHAREVYETKFIEEANSENCDPIKRDKLIKCSEAFTDSYTLDRMLRLLDDDLFIKRLPKAINKKFNRYCDDFDFVLSKALNKKKTIRSIITDMQYIVKVPDNLVKIFIVTLCESSKNATASNSVEVLYMYNAIENIHRLSCSGNTKTDFTKECISHIKTFFSKLEEKHNQLTNI